MPPKKAQAAKAATKKQKDSEENKQVPDRTKEEQQSKDEKQQSKQEQDEPEKPKDEPMPDAPAPNIEESTAEEEKPPQNGTNTTKEDDKTGHKRKTPPTASDNSKLKPPKKEARQGSRNSSRTPGAAAASKSATSRQILNFLLSKDSLPYCFPEDELSTARSGKFSKSYSLTPPSLFTPFEHLITAHLLSKPLSHTLGMRSTRTLLNAPYSFSTPAKLKQAGEDKIYKALEEAKTQHRQKTASYLADMGAQYAGKGDDKGDKGDSDEMLDLAVEANEGGARATIAHVKNTVKGMGQTGAEIFCRRVQACDGWGEAIWPFADPRSIDALRECGVKVADADELQEMIERDVDWDKVGDMGLNPQQEKKGVDEKDYEVQVAVEFVTVLERAVGCQLEGKTSQLRQAASEWK